MEVNNTPRSRFNDNKYIRYREEYERARNFSKHLDSAQLSETSKPKTKDSKTTDSKTTDSKPANDTKLAATDQPTTDKPAAGDLPKNSEPASSRPRVISKNMQSGGEEPVQSNYTPTSVAAHPVSIPNTGAASDRMLDRVKEYEPMIRAAAARYELPPELIAGVIWQESRGNPRAVSHCGAMGLMQLMPATAANLGVLNAFDPIQNIDGGAKYLRQMLDKFGRVDFAVAAYNAGPGNVSKFNGIPPFKETQDYVPHVLGFANSFRVANAFVQTTPTTAVRV